MGQTPKHVGNLATQEHRGDDGIWSGAPSIYGCPLCGAAVVAPEQHEMWHDAVLEKLIEAAHAHGVRPINVEGTRS